MSTLSEIVSAIEGLTPAEREELARWWQERFDPDQGLQLSEAVSRELDEAHREIARGDVADWEQLKRSGKRSSR